MRAFGDLVDEAVGVDVSGWSFDWLDGRATEERPPWGYSRLLASRLAVVASALDIDTGGGEIIAEAPQLPPRIVVTEGWPANVERARALLSPRGVEVVPVVGEGREAAEGEVPPGFHPWVVEPVAPGGRRCWYD